MSQFSGPYGLLPVADQTGIPRPKCMPSGIANGFANNIFRGAPIRINPTPGLIEPVTLTTQSIWGVFAGVSYTPLGGSPLTTDFWPGGQQVDLTNDFLVYYWPAWTGTTNWQIQADGPVPQSAMGQGFNFSNFTAGNVITGLSQLTAAAAGVAAGSQAQIALVEFATGIASTPGDSFTDLIVGIALPQVIAGFQPSIG